MSPLDGQQIYSTDAVAHEADLSTPLHHGLVRYVPSDDLSLHIRNSLPAKNDRPFVYVPVGYCHRNKDFVQRILSALHLKLPNMVIVTTETSGSIEEQEGAYRVQNLTSHPIAKDWTEQHVQGVLAAKVGRLLESIVESSIEVGAWIIPDCPRRRNAAAQMVCEAIPSTPSSNVVAMGLIGLGEDEEDVLFKKSLDDSKVPVGSPVVSVSQLVYDVGLKDGAPCPGLTHLVMFESPQERQSFRQELLDLVPDYLVAFGNITEDAMKNIFENAKAGSPIVLLKHTGKRIDSLCKMFRHVNMHLSASGESNTRIPPIQGEDSDLVKLFLNTWPASYNSKSIVLADPLIMNESALQKRLLAAITSAFDLKSGGVDMRLSKRKVLDYAWSLQKMCNQHSKRKKSLAEGVHVQLVSCTLLSIIASVLYEKVYAGGGGEAKTTVQTFVYVMTILLPLYITSLNQESNEGVAMANWTAFKIAATKIESEVLKFRCQVGPYRVEEKTEIALHRPVHAFAVNIKRIYSSVSKGNLAEDAISTPPDFWAYDANAPAMAPLVSGDGAKAIPPNSVQVPLTIKYPKGTSFDSHATNTQAQLAPLKSSDGVKMTCPEQEPLTGNYASYNATSFNSGAKKSYIDLVEPSLAAGKTTPANDKNDSTEGVGGYDEEMPATNAVKSDDESTDSSACFVDDRYCPIKTDNYIELRMQHAMLKKADQIKKMAARNKRLNSLIKMITIGSGATAALSLQWAVPIVLAITASLVSGQQFRVYPSRINMGNMMVMQLNELKLWWMSLSMYQKQLPHNKDKLILSAEEIIVKEMKSSFGAQESADEDE